MFRLVILSNSDNVLHKSFIFLITTKDSKIYSEIFCLERSIIKIFFIFCSILQTQTLFKKMIYLEGRITERWDTFSICRFDITNACNSRSWPVVSQDRGFFSTFPMWVQWPKNLGQPSLLSSPPAEHWTGAGAARTQSMLMSQTEGNLLCRSTALSTWTFLNCPFQNEQRPLFFFIYSFPFVWRKNRKA